MEYTSSFSNPAISRATGVSETLASGAIITPWLTKRSATFWKKKRPAIKQQLLKQMLFQSHFIAVCTIHDGGSMGTQGGL